MPVVGRVLGLLSLALFTSDFVIAGTLSSHSSVEVNLGPVPIDHYTDDNDTVPGYPALDFVKNCTEDTVRECYQSQLAALEADGVTGVRFMYYFCGGAWSTAIEDCTGSPSLNSDWVDNLKLFLQDIADAGISDVTPSPQFWGAFDSNLPYCDPILSGGQVDYLCGEDDGEYNFLEESEDPTLNDGVQWLEVTDTCGSGTVPLFFWPAAPFGVRGFNSDGDPVGPWKSFYNDSYNCSPANPYFVGWSNIYAVIDAVIAAADDTSPTLAVRELDIYNEIDLTNFTVLLRMLYDNKHGGTGNPAVVDVVRYYMDYYGYNPKKVTFSVSEASPNVGHETFDCGSVFGDSARIMALSELTSGLAGDMAGGVVGQPTGFDASKGLYCGGSVTMSMPMQPREYPQPQIVDVHVYNKFAQYDEDDVTITFDDIRAFLDSFAPTNPPGWRVSIPDLYGAEVMIGETFAGVGCIPTGGATSAQSIVDGYNASDLTGGNGFIVRPWFNLIENFSWPEFTSSSACYPFEMSVTPPYSGTP